MKKKKIKIHSEFFCWFWIWSLGWENSDNNDLLSTEYCAPYDLWFHARGAGGSHVVLKESEILGDFTKKLIQEAAQIAAYYSKMRNASRVQVAFTFSKFVKNQKVCQAEQFTLNMKNLLMSNLRCQK